MALKLDKPERLLPTTLAPGALCGSMACRGCYEVGEGKKIHPPRAGYDQARLAAKR